MRRIREISGKPLDRGQGLENRSEIVSSLEEKGGQISLKIFIGISIRNGHIAENSPRNGKCT